MGKKGSLDGQDEQIKCRRFAAFADRERFRACQAGGEADGKHGARASLPAEGNAKGARGRAGEGACEKSPQPAGVFLKEKPRFCSDQSLFDNSPWLAGANNQPVVPDNEKQHFNNRAVSSCPSPTPPSIRERFVEKKGRNRSEFKLKGTA
ncbi:uncharacterized protein M6G45_014480 [Spheniscus humboldti]